VTLMAAKEEEGVTPGNLDKALAVKEAGDVEREAAAFHRRLSD